MVQHFLCPQGHQWQGEDGDTGLIQDPVHLCPMCGLLSQRLSRPDSTEASHCSPYRSGPWSDPAPLNVRRESSTPSSHQFADDPSSPPQDQPLGNYQGWEDLDLSKPAARANRASRPWLVALAVFLLVIGLAVFLPRGGQQKGLSQYNQAIAASDRGNYDLAINLYSEAIRLDPRFKDAYVNRAYVHLKKKQPDEAIADASEAIRLDPTLAFAYLNRSAGYLNKGQSDEAIADATEAIRLNPNFADAHANRSIGHLNKGQDDQAIADADEAIRLNPRHGPAFSNRSAAYLNKGNFDQAITDASEAILIDPTLAVAFADRGMAYLNKGNLDQAIADNSEAIRLDPKLAYAYFNRGLAHQRRGDFAQAQRDFDEANRLNPGLGKFKQK